MCTELLTSPLLVDFSNDFMKNETPWWCVQALSIGDLPTVVATCEMVKPSALFGQNLCLLQQPVLLSLIHQLCKDLDTDTGMKLG